MSQAAGGTSVGVQRTDGDMNEGSSRTPSNALLGYTPTAAALLASGCGGGIPALTKEIP